jgi:hypothetical protein
MIWVAVVLGLVIVAGIVAGASPVYRYFASGTPGEPGAADPTGNIPPADAEFERPRDEGGLL